MQVDHHGRAVQSRAAARLRIGHTGTVTNGHKRRRPWVQRQNGVCSAKTTADHTGDMYVSPPGLLLPCGLTDSFVASQVVVVCTWPAVYRRAASTAADLMRHNGRRIQLPELRIVVLKCREYSEAALRAK